MEKIVQELRRRYPDRDAQLVRAVAANVHYSGQPDDVLARADVIDKLFAKMDARRAEGRVSAESPDICPICKMPLKPVKLDRDRPALHCPRHHVVFPVRENKQ